MDRELITDEGWPCQRLRLAFGSLFFFLFEITIGKQLPGVMSAMIFGLGVGSFASALGGPSILQVAESARADPRRDRSAITLTPPARFARFSAASCVRVADRGAAHGLLERSEPPTARDHRWAHGRACGRARSLVGRARRGRTDHVGRNRERSRANSAGRRSTRRATAGGGGARRRGLGSLIDGDHIPRSTPRAADDDRARVPSGAPSSRRSRPSNASWLRCGSSSALRGAGRATASKFVTSKCSPRPGQTMDWVSIRALTRPAGSRLAPTRFAIRSGRIYGGPMSCAHASPLRGWARINSRR